MSITLSPSYVANITLTPTGRGKAVVLAGGADPVLLTLTPFYKCDPGNAASKYVHTQSSVSDTWTVNHNLGARPIVSVFSIGWVEVEASIVHTSENQTIIQFNTATAGFAVCQ